MARKGHKPYPAQLDSMLADGVTDAFCARSLADVFENGNRDPQSAIRYIDSALKEAFGQRKLVRFDDADGKPLCVEARDGRNGSATVLYAPHGAGSPQEGYEPVDIDAVIARRERGSDDEPSGAPEAGDEANADASPVHGADGAVEDEPPDPEELSARVKAFPPPTATAPTWLSEAVLRAWVCMPGPTGFFREGLDRARGADKLALIRAGVVRNQRGKLPRDGVTAGHLAQLTRTSRGAWGGTVRRALADHANALSADDLVALVGDPLTFYEDTDVAPEVVLLFGVAVGVDEPVLVEIDADCVRLLDVKRDPVDTLRERVEVLEGEAIALRQAAKDADKEARAAEKRVAALEDRLAAAREERDHGLSAAERDHAQEVQALSDALDAERAKVDDLQVDAERLGDLEARTATLETHNSALDAEAQGLRSQAALAAQAQRDADRLLQRVRELTRELEAAGSFRGLPVGDPRGLIAALARPVGQGAKLAAERLAAGRIADGDEALLSLAATVSRLADAIDTAAEADAARTAGMLNSDDRRAATAEATVVSPEEASLADRGAPPAVDSLVEAPVLGPADAPKPAPSVAAEAAEPAEQDAVVPARPTRARRRPRFQVTPMGGAGEVGGSAILVKTPSGSTVLLDCGQRVKGEYGLESEPPFHRGLPTDAHLDAVLISHAHIDHVGSLPILHREVSALEDAPVPVYMTGPTRALTQIMLEDSARIQQYRLRDAAQGAFSEYSVGVMEAAYKQVDVDAVMDDEVVTEVDPGRLVPIGDDLVARFLPVAHILGSCAIHLTDTRTDTTLLYTGDLGPFTDPQLTLPHYPVAEMLAADVVIMESTYGRPNPAQETDGKKRRGLHGRERAAQLLHDAASDAFARGGSLLLPSFSLGRTQELAKIIDKGRQDGSLPKDAEILVAGMGERIFSVYHDATKAGHARADDLPRVTEMGRRLREFGGSFEEAVHDALQQPSIIIASPAMLTSGWSRAFLTEMVDQAQHEIRLTGYLPRHSGGIPHLHRLAKGQTINLSGTEQTIRCGWERVEGLSAHAPASDLRAFARHMVRQRGGQPVAFGMVHGDPPAQEALAADVTAEHEHATAKPLINGDQWRAGA